jgi:ribosomal protein S18 acetylase RimI-like enzyme
LYLQAQVGYSGVMMTIENVTTNRQIATVKTLAHTIWNEHYTSIIGKDQVEYMLAALQNSQAIARQIREGSLYYLFKHGERELGFMAIETIEKTLFLSKFYINAADRNRGYGKEACIFLEELARQKRVQSITLSVIKNNALAIKSYEKLGFTHQGSIVQSIGNGFVMDDFKMEKMV